MASEVRKKRIHRGARSVLDLFCGAGGFTLGLEAAGFETVGGIDVSDIAGGTFVANFGERPLSRFGRDGDLLRIEPNDLADALADAGVDELDLLVATPPCQGFSRVGRGKLDWMAERSGAFVLDPRNHLYRQAVAVLRRLRPRMFVFENVSGILHVRGRNVAESVCEAVEAAGYHVKCALLNAAWYGVPQTRERLFIIGVRSDLAVEPRFPRQQYAVSSSSRGHLSQAKLNPALWKRPKFFVPFTELPTARQVDPAWSVREAFADLPSFSAHLKALRLGERYRPRRDSFKSVDYRTEDPPNEYCRLMRRWRGLGWAQEVSDHFCRWTPRDFETFRRMKPDDRYRAALDIARERYQEARAAYDAGKRKTKPLRRQFIPPYPDDCFDEKWRKLVGSLPSHTLTAHLSKDTYSHIHFNSRQARAITVREAARLQSFPDAFRFEGNTGDMFTQIGNAVPPLLAKAVGNAIKRTLDAADDLQCRVMPQRRMSTGTG